MNSVPKLFSCSYADCWTENHFSTKFGVLTPNRTHSHTLFWGCVSRWFGRALAWHARGHRFDPGNLHQKDKASHRNVWCFFVVYHFRQCSWLSLRESWICEAKTERARTVKYANVVPGCSPSGKKRKIIKSLSAEHGQSAAETMLNRPAHRGQAAKRLQICNP